MKKVPETDAIFARLAEVTPAADADPTILRMSVDAKATVLLGRFSRGGASRVTIKALDHDFRPTEKVTPLGGSSCPRRMKYICTSSPDPAPRTRLSM